MLTCKHFSYVPTWLPWQRAKYITGVWEFPTNILDAPWRKDITGHGQVITQLKSLITGNAAALRGLLLSHYSAFAGSLFSMLLLSAINTSTGSFIFFLEDCFTTRPHQSQLWKWGNLAALPSYRFCRRLALKTVSGADCVYMQAGSLESSRCCSCPAVVLASIAASCAGPPLPPQGGSRVGEQPPSPHVPHAKTGHVSHTQKWLAQVKNTPSTTTLELTLHRLFFTHTKYFAVLAIIIAHIQT